MKDEEPGTDDTGPGLLPAGACFRLSGVGAGGSVARREHHRVTLSSAPDVAAPTPRGNLRARKES